MTQTLLNMPWPIADRKPVSMNLPSGYHICYKSGQGPAMGHGFATEKWAQFYLNQHGNSETMHVVRKDKP